MELKTLNDTGFWESQKQQKQKQLQGSEERWQHKHQEIPAENHKGLTLDPQRNHDHHYLHQNPILNFTHLVQREEETQQNHHQAFNFPYFQQDPQTQHQHQHFFGETQQLQLQEQQQAPKKRSFTSSSSTLGEQGIEHARSKMGDSHHHQATTSSRLGIRPPSSGAGVVSTDIVEVVRGSHIVRATGRKDRHSKVCTAKGPRDRRVRLAAHTAIQFYDVQDRLGYDRPSKAVDWLIKKAKAAIDELDELPSWNPHSTSTTASVPGMETHNPTTTGIHCFAGVDAIGSANQRTTMVGSGVSEQKIVQNPNSNSTFLPPSLDSDAIADTIKSFFPTGASAIAAAAEAPSSTIQFHQNYPPDLLSRTSSQSQDLRLSLQSFQDPILLHQHHAQTHQNEQSLFSGSQNPLGFDGSSAAWAEHHHNQQQQEMNRFQRMVAWNSGGGDSGDNGGGSSSSGGFTFNSLLPTQQSGTSSLQQQQPSLFGQSQFFFQRGPLQSSNSPSIRAWMMDQQNQQSISHDHHHQISQSIHHQPSFSGMGFTSGGGFSGFHIPARIHGEEEHDGISDKPAQALISSLPSIGRLQELPVDSQFRCGQGEDFSVALVQWRVPWEEEI
ncbi:hypothetical protein EV1_007815 [Malus domestica]